MGATNQRGVSCGEVVLLGGAEVRQDLSGHRKEFHKREHIA